MKKCQSTDIVHLLYMLDFEHFRQTGVSVTGLEYVARDHGPDADVRWSEYADLVKRPQEYVFDDDDFTPRQLELMKKLAASFSEIGPDVAALKNAANGAYARARDLADGAAIPYEWAIGDEDPYSQLIRRFVQERRGAAGATRD